MRRRRARRGTTVKKSKKDLRGPPARDSKERPYVYFSSVTIARCFPRTSVSVCVRSRGLNRTVPDVNEFTTTFPSGVVELRSPSSRNTTTVSLSWKCIGVATPMHFHDKDTVVVFLDDGDLSSTTPDGKVVVNSFTSGTVRFNPRDRTHTETLVRGKQRAIVTELK